MSAEKIDQWLGDAVRVSLASKYHEEREKRDRADLITETAQRLELLVTNKCSIKYLLGLLKSTGRKIIIAADAEAISSSIEAKRLYILDNEGYKQVIFTGEEKTEVTTPLTSREIAQATVANRMRPGQVMDVILDQWEEIESDWKRQMIVDYQQRYPQVSEEDLVYYLSLRGVLE